MLRMLVLSVAGLSQGMVEESMRLARTWDLEYVWGVDMCTSFQQGYPRVAAAIKLDVAVSLASKSDSSVVVFRKETEIEMVHSESTTIIHSAPVSLFPLLPRNPEVTEDFGFPRS